MNDKFELSQRFKAKDDIFPGELGTMEKLKGERGGEERRDYSSIDLHWIPTEEAVDVEHFWNPERKAFETFLSYFYFSKTEFSNHWLNLPCWFDLERMF